MTHSFIPYWVHQDETRTHQVTHRHQEFYDAVEVQHVVEQLEQELRAYQREARDIRNVLGLTGAESRPVSLYIQDHLLALAEARVERGNAFRMWESYQATTTLLAQEISDKDEQIERLKTALKERR